MVRRVGQSYPIEDAYATAQVTNTRMKILDAHVFLDYCRLRAEVARLIESLFCHHDACALLGFLTGSLGPTIDARELVGALSPNAIRFASDLKGWAPPGSTPISEFQLTMDNMWGIGFRHFILADEYVGGGSINRALDRSYLWMKQRNHSNISFSVVAFAHKSSRVSQADLNSKVASFRAKGMPICIARVLTCEKLLEMDKKGKIFNPVHKANGIPGQYVFKRSQAELLIKRPAGGASGGGGAISADQIFNILIARAIGRKPALKGPFGKNTNWPESIKNSTCDECKSLLKLARKAWMP